MKLLAYLRHRILEDGYAPTLKEIARHFDWRSEATVHGHLSILARKGYITRAHRAARGITLVDPT